MFYEPSKLKFITDKKHKFYDPRIELPLKRELIDSIKKFGVQQEIKVWKDRESGDVYLVDGLQRTKNCVAANKELLKEGFPQRLIPAVTLHGTLEHAFAIKVLLNGGRQDPGPQDQARLAERLLEMGYDEQTTATILHLTPSTLKNYRALLECSAPVRAAVDDGTLPITMAYKLAKLEPAEQKETLAKMLKAAHGVSGKKRRGKKMRAVTGEQKMRSKKEIEAMIATLEERLGSIASGTIKLLQWVLGGEALDLDALKVPGLRAKAESKPEPETVFEQESTPEAESERQNHVKPRVTAESFG
jgi:ParB family chromosome partitioning protein